MKRLLKGAALLGAAAGIAYAVKGYLESSGGMGGGEVQISFDDGTSETLVSNEAEEFTDIASGLLGDGGN